MSRNVKEIITLGYEEEEKSEEEKNKGKRKKGWKFAEMKFGKSYSVALLWGKQILNSALKMLIYAN